MGARSIAILGANGLIGHKLAHVLKSRFESVHAFVRTTDRDNLPASVFDGVPINMGFHADDFAQHEASVLACKPDVILNCVGITKRRPEVNNYCDSIAVNSLFPHALARWAAMRGIRVLHFSTDCVFDGETGDYTEQSHTSGRDAYGMTKALGEIRYDHSLTIRSSFVGRELSVKSELLEWLLSQNGKAIKGFKNALYSGISTIEMARIVGDIIEHQPELNGLYNLSTLEPISKFDLLTLAVDSYQLDIEIVPEEDFVCRPTLDSRKLREKMEITLPSWPDMMDELANENALYE